MEPNSDDDFGMSEEIDRIMEEAEQEKAQKAGEYVAWSCVEII